MKMRLVNDLKNATVEVCARKIVEYTMYVVGVVLLCFAISVYSNDLCLKFPRDEFEFHERKYVAVDAYNYIISASRSSAVMVKSLILAVSGFATIIIGQLMAIITSKR